MGKAFSVSFFICVFFAVSSSATAQQLQLQDTLKEVEVRSKSVSVNRSVTPVQVLSSSELEKLNSLSVADAVRHLSGVQLKDYGGIGGLKTINVRSLGATHTAVFYDGIPLDNARNGQIDLSKFSLDNIAAIELYNGQKFNSLQPARAYSAAASLYLEARKPDFTSGNTLLKASLKTGSFGLVNPSLFWQQKVSENIYSTVSAEFLHANGKYKFHYINGPLDSLVTRNNSDIISGRLEAGVNGTLKDSSEWSVKLYSYLSERGLPRAVITNRLNASQQLWDDTYFVRSSYKKAFSSRFRSLLNARYSYNYSRYLDPEYLNTAHKLDNRYRENEIYFSLANVFDLSQVWSISLAGDYFRNGMDANLTDFAYPVRNTFLVAFSSTLNLHRLQLQGSLLETLADEKVKSGTSAANRKELSPAISVSWQPFENPDFHLRSFYKNSFRLPTFNDLYYTLAGNINLKPEFAKQYDAGFTYNKTFNGALQHVSVQADGYYNRVKDKIIAIPTANLFRWSMVNLGVADIYGLDISTTANFKTGTYSFVDVSLNYTYQDARDMTPGGLNYKQKIPYSPENSGSASVNLGVKNYSFNYNFIYTGWRYSLRPNIPEKLPGTLVHARYFTWKNILLQKSRI